MSRFHCPKIVPAPITPVDKSDYPLRTSGQNLAMKCRTGTFVLGVFWGLLLSVVAQALPTAAAVDAEVATMLIRTGAKGTGVAIIDHGKVAYVRSYGMRNAR